MKKRNLLMFISVLFIIFPFFINKYSVLRLLSYGIGIILFSILLFKYKKNFVVSVIVIFTIVFSSYFIDYYLSHFKRIPIFADKITSSKKVISYNSLMYNVQVCDKKWNVDKFSKKGYLCDYNDIGEINVNDFLSYYELNKNAYYKVRGKISKIVGETTIEMQPYEIAENSKNGNVNFKPDMVYKFNFGKIDIKKYKIYDEIIVIGKVDNIIKEKELTTFEFNKPLLYSSKIYDDFSIKVDSDNKCDRDKTAMIEDDDYKYYKSCLNNILVVFDNANIYDIDYVLLDKKITLNNLIQKSKIIAEDEYDNIYYNLDDLNYIVCKNKDVIFGNNIGFDYCESSNDNSI